MIRQDHIHLDVSMIGLGHHMGDSRHPDVPTTFTDMNYFVHILQMAECGLFTTCFLADGFGIRGTLTFW